MAALPTEIKVEMSPQAKETIERATALATASRDAFVELSTSEAVVKYFAYSHLPEKLQVVSKPFGDLALLLCEVLPRSAERAAGLRKLLEAKDCAVRAALP
jgi:hypothetical protein